MALAKASPELGVVERSIQLLKLLATAGKRGLPLTTLAAQTGMPNSTVHRLLKSLGGQAMVVQHASNKRYALGPLAFELGLAAAAAFDPRAACREHLIELADQVADTVYLTVRSGSEAVCLDRHEGPSPIRVLTLDIGSRRPLGLGAGGQAILAYLPSEEREEIIAGLPSMVRSWSALSEAQLRAALDHCRQKGYSYIRDRVSPGVSAVGVPILDSFDRPIAAVSVAAVHSRLPGERVPVLAKLLQKRLRAIRRSLFG